MPVGTVDRQTDRDSSAFTKQAAFDASLGAIRRIGTRFFSLPEELLSWRHPCSANSNQCPCIRRIPEALPARILKIRRLAPISGTGRERLSPNKYSFHPTLPLATCPQYEKYPVHYLTIRYWLPTASPRMGIDPRRNQYLKLLP